MSVVALHSIRSKEELITFITEGNKVKYLFFWGHTPKDDSIVGKECLSQWYESAFEIDGIHYPTAEHYMMAEKARLFNDNDALMKILESKHPGDAKKLGRTVKGYQEDVWKNNRFDIVVRGNQSKFSQNEILSDFLINTGERVLVEASPRDRIWGIGMEQSNPDSENPDRWRGLNLLGFALIQVRNSIMHRVD